MTQKNSNQLNSHEAVLKAIVEAIDIPKSLDQIARDRYASIGRWLDRDNSGIRQFDPEIYPQGSFLLGTVIRPVGDADEFDIDLVCTLKGTKNDFTMSSLKVSVGEEIKSYAKKNGFIKEPEDGRRCWTLEYSDKANFHMDILPALPNAEQYRLMLEESGHTILATDEKISEKAIAITDKTLDNFDIYSDDWPVSNPKGFAIWFKSCQANVLNERKQLLMESDVMYASVDQVPDHKVKTPLQQAIQLLKRHRDSMFDGKENKPISVIITTLAGHSYNNETTITETLRSLLKNMGGFIINPEGESWIPNPVNPIENFADKWKETPEKKQNFLKWLEKAQRDFGLYLVSNNYRDIPEELKESITQETMSNVLPLIVASVSTPAIISFGEAEAATIISKGGATKPWRK
ncbi:MAG: nucleotidyltransferase [Magnetococcales bacterium]|nr:nucleotidyltransferase [Magnetococcales bacterium]